MSDACDVCGQSSCGSLSLYLSVIESLADLVGVRHLLADSPVINLLQRVICPAVCSNTYVRLTALFPGLPRWAGTRKVKPIWILLKQETVSGSGISCAVCKSAPRSRQITTPAPHHLGFYRPDALPAAQPTASKHWRRYTGYSSLQQASPLHELTCHMGSHSVTCHPALPQAGTRFSDPGGMQGWVMLQGWIDLVGSLHTEVEQCPRTCIWSPIPVLTGPSIG